MCLGLPAEITEIVDAENGIARAVSSDGGRNVNLSLLDDVGVGDWVLVHLGFAMEKIDAEHAAETQRFLDQLGGDLEDPT